MPNKCSAVAQKGDRLATIDMGQKLGAVCVCPFWAGSPSNTMWPGSRPTSVPSGILIHPTVWPQYANGQTDGQRTDRRWRTVLQTVAQKPINTGKFFVHSLTDHPTTISKDTNNLLNCVTISAPLCLQKSNGSCARLQDCAWQSFIKHWLQLQFIHFV